MYTMKRLLLGVSLVALSTGAALAAPAIVESGLNLRSGPGTEYAVITTLPAGTTVNASDCAGGWCRVSYNGEEGYASRAYLGIETAAEQPYPSYGYYGYYEPGYGYYNPDYGYYNPFATALGLPYEGFEFGFVGHRHQFRPGYAQPNEIGRHEFGEGHRFGENRQFVAHNFGHTAGALGRANFAARSFGVHRSGEAHFAGGRVGAVGQAMPNGSAAHMASIGHVGAPGFGGGYHHR